MPIVSQGEDLTPPRDEELRFNQVFRSQATSANACYIQIQQMATSLARWYVLLGDRRLFRKSKHRSDIVGKRVELRDVTLVLTRWEAVHATGGGQWGAKLRDDYYGGGFPQSKAAD